MRIEPNIDIASVSTESSEQALDILRFQPRSLARSNFPFTSATVLWRSFGADLQELSNFMS